jgi:hypothetical protein
MAFGTGGINIASTSDVSQRSLETGVSTNGLIPTSQPILGVTHILNIFPKDQIFMIYSIACPPKPCLTMGAISAGLIYQITWSLAK